MVTLKFFPIFPESVESCLDELPSVIFHADLGEILVCAGNPSVELDLPLAELVDRKRHVPEYCNAARRDEH